MSSWDLATASSSMVVYTVPYSTHHGGGLCGSPCLCHILPGSRCTDKGWQAWVSDSGEDYYRGMPG